MPKDRATPKRRAKTWKPSEADCLRDIAEAAERYLCASSGAEREDATWDLGLHLSALHKRDEWQDGQLDTLIDEWVDSGAWTQELRTLAYKALNARAEIELKQFLLAHSTKQGS